MISNFAIQIHVILLKKQNKSNRIMAAAENDYLLKDASIAICTSTQTKSFVWNYFGHCVVVNGDGKTSTYKENKIFCNVCLQYAQKHSKNEKEILKK